MSERINRGKSVVRHQRKQKRPVRGAMAAGVAAALFAPALSAATLTWDANTITSGAQDGSGTWNSGNTNWWNGAANVSWNNATPDNATFGAASGNAGVITLGENITVGTLRLDVPGSGLGYALAGSGANTLTVSSIVPVTGTISTINTTLAGTGNVSIAGGGSVALLGANTYTGTTTIASGATVGVNSLGNDGETASSLGAPTGANRTLILGSANSAGILNYVGAATSTDRNVDISNANAGSMILSNGSGKLTWTGNVSGAHSFTLGGDSEGELRGTLNQPAGNLSKTGYSTWTIASSGTNLVGPSPFLAGGGLTLDFSNLASATNLINSTAGPSLNGVHLKVIGNATTATSQTFASTALGSSAGQSAITLVSQGPAVSLALGSLNRAGAGSSVNFSIPAGSTVTTSRSNSATTILGGWATVGGNTWAVSAGDGTNAGAISGLTTYSSDPTAAGVDLDVPSGTSTLTANVNSIRFNNSAASTLNLDAGRYVLSGGILVTSDVGANLSTIGGSFSLSSSNGADLIIFQNNTSAGLTISATVANSITKSGDGLLTLTGGNGGGITTRINAGTLSVGSPTPLGGSSGTNAVVFPVGSTGTLQLTGTNTFSSAKGITVNGNGIIEVPSGATMSGANSVGGAGNLTKTGAGALVFSSTNSANTFTGALIIKQGTVRVTTLGNGGVASGIGAGSADPAKLVLDGGVLQLSSTATGPASSNRLFTLGSGGGTIDNNNATAANAMSFTGWGDIALSGSNTPRTLTLKGVNTGSNLLVPSLGDNGTGATSLTKDGAGAWILAGNNSYSGATTVSAGTLVVNAIHSGAGNYSVAGNATLGGDGDIALAASKFISAAGTSGNLANIAPGAASAIGVLTVDGGTGVAFGNFSNLLVDVGAGTSDQLRVQNTLNLSSASDALTINGTADGVTSYVIATYGSLVGTFGVVNNLPPGYTLDYGTGTDSQIVLSVPEPGFAGVLMLGGLAGLARRRRRG